MLLLFDPLKEHPADEEAKFPLKPFWITSGDLQTCYDKNDTISSHAKISMISLISGLSLKLHLK